MANASDPVLLDNCAISACVSAGAWDVLARNYKLETVREVEVEAMTGYVHRTTLHPTKFHQDVMVHPVTDEERFEAQVAHRNG